MMKNLTVFILAACLSCAAFAQGDMPASVASVETLLEVTETRQMYDATMKEAGKMIDQSMAGAMNRLPPEKQARLKRVLLEVDKLLKEEADWEKMKPLYVRIYAETLSQKEVDDLTRFYQTPSGKAFIRKQPQLLQKISALTQERISAMMERLPGIVQKAMTEDN